MRGLAFLFSMLFLTLSPNAADAACADDVVEIRGDWGQAQFKVELADTAQERAQGLMFRETLPRTAGMLFVYETPRRVAFWMKNTLIPLDMIFADATGRVERVHANAVPGDETSIPGGDNIQFVLEINGGLAQTYGITAGSELRHPSIAQRGAVWPCEP